VRQPYELSIAMRYLRARSSHSFISFISAVSMIGIGLAVAVLIVVLSVMNGFEHELQQRILGMVSDATISGFDGPLDDWQSMRTRALDNPEVGAVAPYVEGQALAVAGEAVEGGDGENAGADGAQAEGSTSEASASETSASEAVAGVTVRGVDAELERQVSNIGAITQRGDIGALTKDSYNVVIGANLAATLGVDVGDEVVLVLADGRVTPAGFMPRHRAFTVAGVFEAGMFEYDRGLVFVSFADAARLFRTGGRATGLRLDVTGLYDARTVGQETAQALANEFGGKFYVDDWTRQHFTYFRSIQLQKSIMFVILSLVIAVAAFNIVSTLMMVVRDKRGDIAILRSFGSTPRSIMTVFGAQGTFIGVVGTLLGIALALLVTWQLGNFVALLESWFDVDLLSADVYFLSDLPTQLRPREVLEISALALGLAIAATFYPAFAAARQPPAEALRYE
jgi:lipoprotein-releasing system permease protein